MSLRIPSRQLARPAGVLNSLRTSLLPIRTLTSSAPRPAEKKSSKNDTPPLPSDPEKNWNPILAQYTAKQEAAAAEKPKGPKIQPTPSIPTGALPPTSIFDVVPQRTPAEQLAMEQRARRVEVLKALETPSKAIAKKQPPRKELAVEADADTPADSASHLDRHIAAYALDPFPAKRRAWERKRVIRTIRHRGRLSKTALLLRTERSAEYKSPFFNTSVKKLTKLANQIAGKPVAQALVQMRFSKKKVAREVLASLKMARDTAVVERGMGLGKAEGRAGESVEVEDKRGKTRVVRDRTEIYVDQAWVGRGPYSMSVMPRARGRADVLRHPKTSISFVLKEEATRIRLSDEYKKKRDNRKLWVQLPDRPITAQRQYALW